MRPFSLWLSRAAGLAAPSGLPVAKERLALERRTVAERGAGAMRGRRAAMDQDASGGLERREQAEPYLATGRPPTELAAPAPGAAPSAATGPCVPRTPDGAARSPASAFAAERLEVELRQRERAAGPELQLSLGSTLEVRLSQAPRGVELAVRGPQALARMARAEMPSLVQALLERGVRVARTEVRPAGGGESPPGARPPALAR